MSSCRSRRAVFCTTRRPPSPRRSTRRRSGRATAGARMSSRSTAGSCLSSRRGERTAVTSSCATRSASSRVATAPSSAAATRCCRTRRSLCATAWMHGVFGAQLTIGNTSFHKLFSVSRDPYNITRASGLRMLMETKDGWRLLTVPSAFEMGLNDCRWIYRLGERTMTVSATVSGDEPAMQWRVTVEGQNAASSSSAISSSASRNSPIVGRIEIDAQRKRFTFRPDPEDLWGQKYPRRRLSSGDKHAPAHRGDRRRRTALRRREAPQRRIRGDPDRAR